MQSDEEVGKVAQAVPIIISRTLELFVESMLTKTLRITNARNAKTLSPSHMKQCIMSESRFDFLRELVKNIPDINVAEEQQCDNYPERRESSEDGMLSIESMTKAAGMTSIPPNGVSNNPNGGTAAAVAAAWLKANQRDGEANASSSCSSSSSVSINASIHPHWKLSKQHSIDSLIHKNQTVYSTTPTPSSNDFNTPINYSIKIKLDENSKAPPPKFLRMESTPASFGSNNNLSSPIVMSNYLPSTAATTTTTTNTMKLPDGDTQPIINFDFSKIPLLPSAAATAAVSTPQTATTPQNHSHSATNLLTTGGDTAKHERPSTMKSQSAKPMLQSSASSTVTSNTSVIQNSSSIVATAAAMTATSIPSAYQMPLSTGGTLEMDEDYDNI